MLGYNSYFKRIEVAIKIVILKEGEISKKVLPVDKECIRARFKTFGDDVKFQFFLFRLHHNSSQKHKK
jgi:hypothetical protein